MNESIPTKTSSSPSSKRGNNFLTTPVAVVIAGVLIALAIYFGSGGSITIGSGGDSGSGRTAGTGTTAGSGTAAKPAAQPAAGAVGNMREVTDDDNIRGAKNAKVTIVEYSDLECPFCKRFHATLQQAIDEYPNDVRWVYRHAPLVQLHRKAPAEANAAECAGEQEKFWEFIDIVFETTQGNDSLNLATLPDLARQASVGNIAQFEKCVVDEKYKDVVDADLADAQSAGLRGTPYSVVIGPGDKRIPISGAQQYSQVKATIDSLL